MKRIIIWILSICMLLPTAVCFAENTDVTVTLDSKTVNMKTQPVYKDGTLFVPVMETMDKLGSFIFWNEEQKQYEGNRKGIPFVIPADSERACFDSVWIELEQKTQYINGVLMIPAFYIDCMTGIDISESSDKLSITIDKAADIAPEEWSWNKVKKTLPVGEETLGPDTFLSNYVLSNTADYMTAKVVDVDDGLGFNKALEIETLKTPVNTYSSKVAVNPALDVRRGDVAVLTFYARKIKSTHESGNSFTEAIVEQNFGPCDKSAQAYEVLNEGWQLFVVPAYSAKLDMATGKFEVNFRVGYKPQVIQIADVRLTNYKGDVSISTVAPDVAGETYKGMEDGALWREEALRRIEKYRKADMNISVVDTDGNPVPNAQVSADMTRNEFMFGTAADTWLFKQTNNEKIYKSFLKKYFNTFTPESNLKWPAITENDGADGSRLINWGADNNFYMRGHCLLWDSLNCFPKDMQSAATMDEVELREKLNKHIIETIRLFGDSVCQWDILNEPCSNNLLRGRFGNEFAAEWFKTAKAALSGRDVKLYLNEIEITGHKTEKNKLTQIATLINSLKSYGAPIDGLGLEDHCETPGDPQLLYNQMEELGQYVDELAITEYDLRNASPEVAAKYLRDQLIVTYSNPKATAFIMWGFTDRYHWNNMAPLFTKNFVAKPALDEYEKLVLNEWVTHEKGVTDENGNFGFRGYRGEYEVTVSVGGKSQKVVCCIKKDEPNTVICVYDGKNITMAPSSTPKLREKTNHEKFMNERDEYQKLDPMAENSIINVTAEDKSVTNAVTDDNYNTFWIFEKENSALTIETKPSDKTMVLSWKYGTPYHFSVYVSDDRVNWEKAENNLNENQFKLQNHKWVKIVSNTNMQLSLSEIDIQ